MPPPSPPPPTALTEIVASWAGAPRAGGNSLDPPLASCRKALAPTGNCVPSSPLPGVCPICGCSKISFRAESDTQTAARWPKNSAAREDRRPSVAARAQARPS
eukprot:scaffold519_cov102-Isochrysis_galbana.AAC.1